jgi:hypothetical protein
MPNRFGRCSRAGHDSTSGERPLNPTKEAGGVSSRRRRRSRRRTFRSRALAPMRLGLVQNVLSHAPKIRYFAFGRNRRRCGRVLRIRYWIRIRANGWQRFLYPPCFIRPSATRRLSAAPSFQTLSTTSVLTQPQSSQVVLSRARQQPVWQRGYGRP